MGKIRSTLDIVLEKTKNLSMSQDDKRIIRRRELADLARAAVRKYLDGKASLKDLSSELDSAGDERPELMGLMRQDLLENIQIDGDNRRVIDALAPLCGIPGDRLEGQIEAFRLKMDGEMIRQMAELTSDLEARGVRGSAVIPNIALSKAWRDTLTRTRQLLVDELSRTL